MRTIKGYAEDALKHSEEYCKFNNLDEIERAYEQGNMGEQKEALDMAIKALEQQPCEDTISRQAAIDALQGRK